jgi:hypothetical protein
MGCSLLFSYRSPIFSVKELKILETAISSNSAFRNNNPSYSGNSSSLPTSAKKSRRVDFVRQAFFKDPACTMVNQPFMDDLSREMHNGSGSASASLPNNMNGSRKRPNAQMSPNPSASFGAFGGAMPAPMSTPPQPPSYYPYPPTMTMMPSNGHSSSSHPPYFNYAMATQAQAAAARHLYPGMIPSGGSGSGMYPPAPTTMPPPSSTQLSPSPTKKANNLKKTKKSPTSSNKSSPTVKVKKEQQASSRANHSKQPPTNTCDSDHPQTPQEHQLLGELLQMGFPDRREILTGIRQSMCNNNNTTSADQVMMWIVSQREEAEEARKMDEARLRSEALRHEQAERCASSVQERLASANTIQDLSSVFGDSWMLHGLDDDRLQTLLKDNPQSFKRFLTLEQKTRQWYGHKLPSYYFSDLIKTNLIVDAECERLEAALYKLEEQQGGVPKLFLNAQEAAAPLENEDDGEIVVVERSPASSKTSLKPNNRSSENQNAAAEVIEIDD